MPIRERTESNLVHSNIGKNYFCSDIHGMLGTYNDVLNELNPEDHLWILGDAGDRGKHGIRIILDIMQRQGKNGKKPKVTYLLGNHDAMLIHCIEKKNKYDLTRLDFTDIINYGRLKGSLGSINIRLEDKKRDGRKITEEEIMTQSQIKGNFEMADKKIKRLQQEKGISKKEIESIQQWLNHNDGLETLNEYLALSKEEQNRIYEFLINSFVYLAQEIGGKKVILTHAAPPKLEKNQELDKVAKKVTFKQYRNFLGENSTLFLLEDRGGEFNGKYKGWKERGFFTICGHTYELGSVFKNEEHGILRIDAGCGHKGKLALYCIESDRIVKYFDEREEVQGIAQGSDGGR